MKFSRIPQYYLKHLDDPRIERNVLSSLGFFITFGAARGIAYAAKRRVGPFRNISSGGVHLHHSAFGILALIGVGYGWLQNVGTGRAGPRWTSRLSSLLYGAGSALTLDEVYLWLKPQYDQKVRGDEYWQAGARQSIYAGLGFGASLLLGLGASPWLRDRVNEDTDKDREEGDVS